MTRRRRRCRRRLLSGLAASSVADVPVALVPLPHSGGGSQSRASLPLPLPHNCRGGRGALRPQRRRWPARGAVETDPATTGIDGDLPSPCRPRPKPPTDPTPTTPRRRRGQALAAPLPLPHSGGASSCAQTQQRSQYPARRPIPSTAPPPDRLRVTTEAHVSKRKVADALGDLVPVWPSALSPSGLLPGRLLHLTSHQSPVTGYHSA